MRSSRCWFGSTSPEFFWGDCSLSNTLFRRDAGALQAYIIDVETAERHDVLTAGQREFDLMIATDNVAGGLLDLQAGGRLTSDIDPIDFALAIQRRYEALWNEITSAWTAAIGDVVPMQRRLERLHDLGFEVEEMEVVTNDDDVSVNFIPKVVEHGYHADRLQEPDRPRLPGRTRPVACCRTSTATGRGCNPNPVATSASTSLPCAGSTACSSR